MPKLPTNALSLAIVVALVCSTVLRSLTGCEKSPPKPPPAAGEPPEAATTSLEKPGVDAGFDSFWERFRAAALSDDNQAIEELTQFPFHTRGQLDDSEWLSYDRRGFLDLLPRLLDQDSGQRPEHDPMRALISRTTTVEHLDGKGGEIYLGSFVFERVGDHWLFTHAFADEP